MPFESRRPKLEINTADRDRLERTVRSRKEPKQQVERARVLLGYAEGRTVSAIARWCRTSRPRVERTIERALEMGPMAALRDLRGDRGRPPRITAEARAWVVSLACQKPKSLGYPEELWTRRLLAEHVKDHCEAAGHPSLAGGDASTVTRILLKNKLRPHKVRYYVERRDPAFDSKMRDVLHVYREVRLLREAGAGADAPLAAFLSYDEKPGIQAIETTGKELPPVPGEHPSITRDYEYVRHGTVTLMAGLDLLDGRVIAQVVRRHRSREFIDWLKRAQGAYPERSTIRIILDNHSAHISKETRAFLAQHPNRFHFVFTPKHGSWLNLIENLFAKLAKTVLREIRVSGVEELSARIMQAINLMNEEPVVFKWKWGLDELAPV